LPENQLLDGRQSPQTEAEKRERERERERNQVEYQTEEEEGGEIGGFEFISRKHTKEVCWLRTIKRRGADQTKPRLEEGENVQTRLASSFAV
jgi:hypothetical protein